MAFAFLQRVNLVEQAKLIKLAQYVPEIQLEGLATGVDNVRTDVYLSPRFIESARHHISKLLAKYGNVEDLVTEDPFSRAMPGAPAGMPVSQTRSGSFIGGRTTAATAKAPEPADFKKSLAEMHVVALNKAKADGNISVDLLARLALLKFLRVELGLQFSQLTERCRARLKNYDAARTSTIGNKSVEMRERFAKFQVGKRTVLRKAGQDIFSTIREIDKETLSKMRRSLFGEVGQGTYELFLNRLLFTADGRDDFLNAEQYVMLGNYDRDPDRFQTMQDFAVAYLRSLSMPTNGEEDKAYDAMLNVPENAQELFGGGTPDESSPKGKAQKALLSGFVEFLEKENVMEHVIASYEAVPLLSQYSPPINPQQLKNALVSKTERKRVETLLEEHGRISPDALHQAVKRVERTQGNDRAKVAGRYAGDFIRYHRDLRRFEAVLAAMDGVNVIANEKLRELSAINNTLYEFLLPEEQKQTEAAVVRHIILKADIRDSTTLTRTLYERGLNPASYFSLNFFDPVNKLLPKYQATKVFIEGDALILAVFEREGEQGFGVGRTCMLAKEMVQIVRAYNEHSQKQGLPTLELGLGICYQDSAPMYLMDGTQRIMISKALNESDRLSGCSKGARKYLKTETQFNVFNFQTVDDADTAGMPDEFLVRYNVGGIHINASAFEKLSAEISLREHNVEMPMLYGTAKVKLFTGLVPLGQGIFHKLIVREGYIPYIDARDFSLKTWTAKKYYEVVVNESIYDQFASAFTQ
jgi:hypothetical protein